MRFRAFPITLALAVVLALPSAWASSPSDAGYESCRLDAALPQVGAVPGLLREWARLLEDRYPGQLPVHADLRAAVEAMLASGALPVRELEIRALGERLEFPVFAQSESTYFRAAVIGSDVDAIIVQEGWKSGHLRGESGGALPPDAPLEDRAIEYARIKGDPRPFPKNASVVGVIREDPVRPSSVVYHTGYDAHFADPSKYIRLDEIELGPGARREECRNVKMVDTTAAFREKGLQSRYSTEGEFVVDREIPASCVVATYRIRFQKVDDQYYSNRNGNTGPAGWQN